MAPKNTTVSDKYKKLTPREHVLARPGMYIGSLEPDHLDAWVSNGGEQFVYRDVYPYISGMYKIYDEMIVNVLDHAVRTREEGVMKEVRVVIDKEKGFVEIYNTGPGIEVAMHDEYKIYIPELIFGNMLTSTNYDDKEERIIGGQNGIGAKACNIFSKRFELETLDKTRGLKYEQTFTDNMESRTDPVITKSKKSPYTRIRFYPDFDRFNMKGFDKAMFALMKRRAHDVCALTPSATKVYFNEVLIECKTFEKYVDRFIGKDRTTSPRIHQASSCDRWEVVVSESAEGFQHMSFVNGVWTAKGGKHVEYVTGQVTKKLSELIKKRRKLEVKPSQIRDCLFVFVRAVIPNPTFDSQTKDTLTTPYSKFGSKWELDAKNLDKIYKMGMVDRVVEMTSAVEERASKKTDGKKRNTIRGIPKLDDANWAGTSKSSQCTLILTEGDSAKTMAISGLSEVGRDKYGVFPLKGKVMNVKDTTVKRINENDEISHLKKIMGLETNKAYEDVTSLRYGRLMIMTDADADGSHIKGLVFNLFHTLWPSLLKTEGFMCSMVTPIVKVTKGKKVESFYNLRSYETWLAAHEDGKGWDTKYYKGLGTSTTQEAKEYFRSMRLMRYDVANEDAEESIDMAFNKKRADDRKRWLEEYDRDKQLEPDAKKSETVVKYDEFVHRDLIHFSNYNLERSIPSVCDGLKRSLRKILYCSIKRKLYKEIKVVQLAGYVSEHGAYHHGEASLHDAIVGMAQTFVGSNNVNLLEPNGQFGTRIQGGKDAASPRYIHTQLSALVPLLFPEQDEGVLEYMHDDGQQVEPIHYYPIIPMVLVNGAMGIGTGFSTTVPCYNPRDVIRNIRKLLENEAPFEMTPWYRGFKGKIENGTSYGVYRIVTDTSVEITELPIGVWTEDFKTHAEALIDKHSSEIKDIENHYTERDVRFVVRFQNREAQRAWMSCADGDTTKFQSEFKLQSTRGLATTNMHLYDAKGVIKKYADVESIMRDFVDARLKCYQARKAYQLTSLREDLKYLRARIKFITSIIGGSLQIMNVPKASLVGALREAKYPEMDSCFDYLIRMPIQTLTTERKEDLERECAKKEASLEDLERTSEKEIWSRELDLLEKKLI